jgi:phosphoribosyl 1,2-cyclic phosphate phosphodiesterase
MNHQTDFDRFAAVLPPGVEPAYDGLVLDVAE